MSFSEWKEVALEEIVDVLGDGLHGTPKYDENGEYYFINGNNLDGNIIIDEKTKKVSYEEFLKYKKDLNERTILISINGTLGNVAFYNGEKVVLGKSACYFNVKENCSKEFIKYIMLSHAFKHYINTYSTGTTIKNMGLKQMRAFRLNLPEINEQKAIAHVLSTLDEKIEVNNQINKTLENMAQAIFKQWFMDFEFPNEDGEPYKSSGGEMIESELGMIPKGWEVRRIGDECFCSLGGTPSRQKSDYWNGDIPWVNSGEVNNFRIYKPSEYITKLGLEKSATKLLKKKTTVLAITGATLGQVSLLEIDTCTNQSVVGISENDKISHVYIYPYVKSVIKKIIGNQTGGAQQHINKGNVEDTKLLIPNKKVLNAYTKLVRPQYDLISSICFENELLTRLRDSLIPKLMSGEIRVPLDEDGDAS